MTVPTEITGIYKNRAENYSKLLEFHLFVYFYLTLKPSKQFERLDLGHQVQYTLTLKVKKKRQSFDLILTCRLCIHQSHAT